MRLSRGDIYQCGCRDFLAPASRNRAPIVQQGLTVLPFFTSLRIITFVIDTDPSMSVKSSAEGGWTLLDSAKSMVDHIIKNRRSSASAMDHYMLLTTEAGLEGVKSGWSDPYNKFEAQVSGAAA